MSWPLPQRDELASPTQVNSVSPYLDSTPFKDNSQVRVARACVGSRPLYSH
jgi:hypothetical protein